MSEIHKWTPAQTFSLLDLAKEKELFRLTDSRSKRNKWIMDEIAESMVQRGHQFTTEQIRRRWKFLKETYGKIERGLFTSGASSLGEDWPFYQPMHDLAGNRPHVVRKSRPEKSIEKSVKTELTTRRLPMSYQQSASRASKFVVDCNVDYKPGSDSKSDKIFVDKTEKARGSTYNRDPNAELNVADGATADEGSSITKEVLQKDGIPATKELLALMQKAANGTTHNSNNIVSGSNNQDKDGKINKVGSTKLDEQPPIDTKERKNDAPAKSNDLASGGTSDTSLKNLSSKSKFSRIGEPQLVARTLLSNVKTTTTPASVKAVSSCSTSYPSVSTTCASSSGHSAPTINTQPFTSGAKPTKRTERFIIKNVSKVSKIYKAANLSYKIRPVQKELMKPDPKCPVIFVGEPAFTDDIQSTPIMNVPSRYDVIKDEDLYDISQLQKTFFPSNTETKPSSSMKYPCPDIPHPSLNRRSNFPFPSTVDLFVPPYFYRGNPSFPHANANNMIRIVARTIPSATNHITTNTVKAANFASHSRGKYIPQMVTPVSSHRPGVVPKTFPVTGSKLAAQHASSHSPKPAEDSQLQAANVKPSNTQSSTFFKQDLMTVNLAGAKSTSNPEPIKLHQQPVKILSTKNASKPEPSKLQQQPVKILNQALPNVKTSIVAAGKPVVFVPNKKDLVPSSQTATKFTITKPIIYKVNDKVQSSKTFTKIPRKPTVTTLVKTPTLQTVAKAQTNPSDPVAKIVSTVETKHQPGIIKPVTVLPTKTLVKPLREGVEVLFEDGVRHFITTLKQMTYQDDEPIKKWSDLKKGSEVAARWVDGQMYDATVVGCYFSMEKKLQPVVEVERLPEKGTKFATKIEQKRVETDTSIGCAECRQVFSSVFHFRKHQKSKCKSPGIIVAKAAPAVTDEMIKVVEAEEPTLNSMSRKLKEEISTLQSDKFRKHKIRDAEDEDAPPEKKRKIKSSEGKKSPRKFSGDCPVFKKGTAFLHRWQLDDGTSKWYTGEVVRVISTDKAFLDTEFEVSYQGEDENYVLKLYEDYPADIRILGKEK